MAYCIKCGISLEIDADTEDGEVCAQCKHSYTRVFADIWQCDDCGAHAEGGSQMITHYPTCVPGTSKRWEDFYSKANEEEEAEMDILMRGASPVVLTAGDVDILDGSINRSVRLSIEHDTEVKRLYHIYKSL